MSRHSVRPGIPFVAADAVEGACFPVEEQVRAEEGEADEDVQAEEDSGEAGAARRCRQPRLPTAQRGENTRPLTYHIAVGVSIASAAKARSISIVRSKGQTPAKKCRG